MSKKVEKDPEIQIENALGRTELWFEKNWKILTSIVAAVLVAAAAVYAYEGFYRAPRGQKAADAMFAAEQLFAAGDYLTALNGSGNNLGFADIADSYSGTREARLAAHYAGICYLKTGDPELAMTYLSKYKPTRGAVSGIINAQNEGLKGDICVQRLDYTAAVEHFRKAVKASNNILTAPLYLKKMGLALEALEDYTGAVAAYQRIADDYPTTPQGAEIAKYIAAAKQK